MSDGGDLELQVETFDIDSAQMTGTEHSSDAFDLTQFAENATLSDEDKNEILSDIEEVVSKNRISVSDDLFAIDPIKNGSFFPVFINILAVAAIGAVFYVSSIMFENTKADLNVETSAYISAEGKLLEELKKDAAEALASKEDEINSIQEELARLDSESQSLRQNIESTITQREAELRRQMEAELAEERRKLQERGISSDAIERELAALEAQKTDQLSAELDAFKTQAAESLREKEEELSRARNLTEDILRQANEDKARIVEETQAKEAALQKQFDEEREALLAQTTEASQKLQEIAKQQEYENLITDQILAGYNAVIGSMEKEEYPSALAAVQQVRSILNDPKIETLPRISKRKPVETYILDTLEDEINLKSASEEETPAGLVNAAEKLFKARGLITQAQTAEEAGNRTEAEKLYNMALGAVPELDNAVHSLRSLELTRRSGISKKFLTEGNIYAESGKLDQAMQSYSKAAGSLASTEEEQTEIASIFSNFSTKSETYHSSLSAGIEAAIRQEAQTEAAEKATAEKEALTADFEQREADYKAQIAALEESIAAMETGEAGRLNETLAKISELETALASAEEQIAELQSSLEAAETAKAEAEARLSEAESLENSVQINEPAGPVPDTTPETSPEIREKITEYEERIAALEAELETLRESSTDTPAIETVTEYEERISELETELAGAQNEILLAKQNNEQLTTRIQTQSAEYEQRITELQNEKAAFEQEVGLLQEEKTQLQKDLDAAVLELVNFVTSRQGDERYAALALLYNEYQTRLEYLIAGSRYEEAKNLLTRFYKEDRVASAFPGLANITSDIEAYVAAREKEEGISEGRTSALSDIIQATAYLERNPDTDFMKTPLDTEIKSEVRFKEAVDRIQDLAVETMKRRVSSSRSTTGVFIGSISSISGDTFIIESLTTETIKEGTPLVIKRISSSGDLIISKAVAVSQRGSRIVGKITEASDTQPRTVDLVYTQK